jgi:signal transduction histidine kinase
MNLTKVISLTCAAAFTVGVSYSAMAAKDEAVTVAEVTEKVKAAAELLAGAKDKQAALKEFEGKKWTWKDTYVFVFDCKADKAIAHPKLAGKPIMELKDPKGTLIFGGDKGLCKAAEQSGGGWVGYIWPKKDGKEAAKASFSMKVAGTDYEVAAGLNTDKKVDNFKIAE